MCQCHMHSNVLSVLTLPLQRVHALDTSHCTQVWRDVTVKGFWLNVVSSCLISDFSGHEVWQTTCGGSI